MGDEQCSSPSTPMSPLDRKARKRVSKACYRCRVRKSKCDESSPCGRCKADNAICGFEERKRLRTKAYPKGYVEMLENQQRKLVKGLRELYKRAQNGEGWPGLPLTESVAGGPLTHDILERLGALERSRTSIDEDFEEDFSVMQQNLLARGAEYDHSRGADSPATSTVHAHSPRSDSTPQTPTSPLLSDTRSSKHAESTSLSFESYLAFAQMKAPATTQEFTPSGLARAAIHSNSPWDLVSMNDEAPLPTQLSQATINALAAQIAAGTLSSDLVQQYLDNAAMTSAYAQLRWDSAVSLGLDMDLSDRPDCAMNFGSLTSSIDWTQEGVESFINPRVAF